MLEIKHLDIHCQGRPMLQEVNLALQPGEILGLLGKSGLGKTTLLRGIMGLLSSDFSVPKGEIFFCGTDLLTLDKSQRASLRGREISMVFQGATASFCPVRTVGSQIKEVLLATKAMEKRDIYRETCRVFAQCNLDDCKRIWNSYPCQLSGGMNQRVALALAMLQQPKLLLADEPTSALDSVSQGHIGTGLVRLAKSQNTAILLVSHDEAFVKQVADRVIQFGEGGCNHGAFGDGE